MLGPVEDSLAHPGDGEIAVSRQTLSLVHLATVCGCKSWSTLAARFLPHVEAGRVRASYEGPTDLAAFTADLVSNFRSACEKAGLELTVECPPLREPVFVDRQMWEQIVLNLLSNAFKFTFDGEISVTVRQAEEWAEFRVQDTGTGIPPGEMARLFERFPPGRERTRSGRTRERHRLGPGSRTGFRLHGGSITAESEVGRGTRFVVTVPLGSAHLPHEKVGGNSTLVSTTTGAMPFVEEALRWLPAGRGRPRFRLRVADFLQKRPVHSAPDVRTAQRRPASPVLVADDSADMRRYLDAAAGRSVHRRGRTGRCGGAGYCAPVSHLT